MSLDVDERELEGVDLSDKMIQRMFSQKIQLCHFDQNDEVSFLKKN